MKFFLKKVIALSIIGLVLLGIAVRPQFENTTAEIDPGPANTISK